MDLADYNTRWDRMESEGQAVHGEADFVDSLTGEYVLDAGCGAGRVGAELARRGRKVVGVDNDADMLAYAAKKPEPIAWVHADLAKVKLDQRFNLIVLAGNILNFAEPASRADVVSNLAAHLVPEGLLIIGATNSQDCPFSSVDRWCENAALSKTEEYSTWEREPFDGGDYRLAVFRSGPTG